MARRFTKKDLNLLFLTAREFNDRYGWPIVENKEFREYLGSVVNFFLLEQSVFNAYDNIDKKAAKIRALPDESPLGKTSSEKLRLAAEWLYVCWADNKKQPRESC